MDEQEAQETVNTPEGVTLGEPPAKNDRALMIAKDQEHAEFFKKYGEEDGFHFFLKAGSDGAFAVKVIQDLLGYFDDGPKPVVDAQAPQEQNITGKLDHTDDVATKEHIEGENTNPPVVVAEENAPENQQ